MKIKISNYSFNASTGQVTFNDFVTTGITLDNVLIITNVTSNVIIYNFADPTTGGTVSKNVLTLTYNTSTMSNTDKLMIYYDDSTVQARDTNVQLLQSQNDLLRRAVKVLESQGSVDSSNRQRVTIDAAPASLTIGTVTPTVTTTLASTTVASSLTAQVGNSYPSSTNPYTLNSIGALVVSEFPVGQEWRVADSARNTFANSIRANIN